MVTSWKKNVIWKSIEISFVFENPKKNFHLREIHERELRSQENHGNWFLPRKSQKNHFQQQVFRKKLFLETGKSKKKDFLIFCKTLRTKICWSENHATSLFWKFSWKSVSWWKIPWKIFWFKKFHGNQFRWFQNDHIEFVNEGSGGLFYQNRLHENCLHQWWNKNQYHFTDGNARWTDFIQMQCNETGFIETKSTNFIHRQPSEVFVNDQKTLKIDIIWKEPNSQSTLEKRLWKNLCW